MIVIIGASASGKTEIAKVLQKKYNFKKCITTTTRPMRFNEVNDVDYHFISKTDFKALINNNKLVEYAIYNDNYYGLQKADLNENSLVIMEPNGANELIDILGNKLLVVYVNTKKRVRKQRMLNRGDDLTDIKVRLKNDSKVFKKNSLKRVDLEIVNNNRTIEDLAKVINDYYKLLY